MKKILVIALAVVMLAVMAVPAFAAETAFVEVASFDFSNTEGLKGYTATWPNNDVLCNAAAAEVADGVIVDGQFVMGTMGFVVDETFDATNGIKVKMDVTLDLDKIGGSPWFQGIVSIFNADGKADEFLALAGTEFEHSYDAYYLNLKGNGRNFQAHTGDLGEGATGNNVVWGGDVAEDLIHPDILAEDEVTVVTPAVTTYSCTVEYIVLPAEAGASVQILVDGVDIGLPNNPEFANFLSDEMLVTIGATHYGDYPLNVTVDNVVVYTMQEVEEGSAPQTGIATIALAIAAIASGAYIVSKKH